MLEAKKIEAISKIMEVFSEGCVTISKFHSTTYVAGSRALSS